MGGLCVLQALGVKHLRSLVISCDVTIGEIEAVVGTDVTVTAAGERGEVTDVLRLVFGDVANAVAFMSDYLDSVLVVGVGRVGFQGGSELAKVLIYMFAVRDACNGKFEIIHTLITLILWPDADVVAFIFDAEVLKFLDWCIRITATNHYLYIWFFNRVTVVIEQVEMGRLLLLSGFILFFTCVVRLVQHISFVGLCMSQPVSSQNDGYYDKKY
jgi:hypothetical protein